MSDAKNCELEEEETGLTLVNGDYVFRKPEVQISYQIPPRQTEIVNGKYRCFYSFERELLGQATHCFCQAQEQPRQRDAADSGNDELGLD